MALSSSFVITSSGKALVEYSRRDPVVSMMIEVQGKNSKPWVPWYNHSRNNEPGEILDMILKNNLNPGIIQTKIDFVLGAGLRMYKKTIVDGREKIDIYQNPMIEKWLADNNTDEMLSNLATDHEYFGMTFTNPVLSRDRKTIARLNHVDASSVRLGLKNQKTQKIDTYYVCPNWGKPVYNTKKPEDNNVIPYPAYSSDSKEFSFIQHFQRYVPGHPYYSPPSWIGNYNYIRLANLIPEFHINALQNGYNLKYHIVIPQDYIDRQPAGTQEQVKADLQAQFDDFLSGVKNVQKAFVSFSRRIDSQNWEKWEIIPLDNKLTDAAYTALFNQTNTAIISGHGTDPTLANVETQGKLSSGTEKRNAANLHSQLKTKAARQVILKHLDIVRKVNQWPNDFFFGFSDIEITKLDANPTGTQTTASNATTI